MKKKLSNLANKFWSLRDQVTYKYDVRIEGIIMTILSVGFIYMTTKFIINLYIGG